VAAATLTAIRLLALPLLLLALAGCTADRRASAPGGGGRPAQDATADVLPDVPEPGDSGPAETPDTAQTSDTAEPPGQDAATDAGHDVPAPEADAGPEEGPDQPQVGCLTDADCPDDGDGARVCCTEALRYVSQCVPEAVCGAGRQDACLTDEQCAARRPGQWSVCCHDRGDRNYCAPLQETCQPLVPCEGPDDCRGSEAGECCSSHTYYRTDLCTVPFLARDPERDCP